MFFLCCPMAPAARKNWKNDQQLKGPMPTCEIVECGQTIGETTKKTMFTQFCNFQCAIFRNCVKSVDLWGTPRGLAMSPIGTSQEMLGSNHNWCSFPPQSRDCLQVKNPKNPHASNVGGKWSAVHNCLWFIQVFTGVMRKMFQALCLPERRISCTWLNPERIAQNNQGITTPTPVSASCCAANSGRNSYTELRALWKQVTFEFGVDMHSCLHLLNVAPLANMRWIHKKRACGLHGRSNFTNASFWVAKCQVIQWKTQCSLISLSVEWTCLTRFCVVNILFHLQWVWHTVEMVWPDIGKYWATLCWRCFWSTYWSRARTIQSQDLDQRWWGWSQRPGLHWKTEWWSCLTCHHSENMKAWKWNQGCMPKKNASGDVTKSDDDRSRSETTGRKTFDPPVAPKGFTTWLHAQSRTFCMWAVSLLTFLNAAGG